MIIILYKICYNKCENIYVTHLLIVRLLVEKNRCFLTRCQSQVLSAISSKSERRVVLIMNII